VIAHHRRAATFGTALVATLLLAATGCSSGAGDADGSAQAPISIGAVDTAGSGSTVVPSVAETPGASTTEVDRGTAEATVERAVPEALQFTAPLVGGGEFSGADLPDKPTVFWFWAPT